MLRKPLLIGLIVLAGGIILVTLLVGISSGSDHTPEETTDLPPEPVVRYEFDIPVDSFTCEVVEIKPNQFLADLLLPRGISYPRIDQLSKASKKVFPVTRMKAGNTCRFFYRIDSLAELAHMIYEIDQTNFVRYTFEDSTIQVDTGERDVIIKEAVVKGVIDSSPWLAMQELNVSTALAIALEDIYAWTIDFFGLQKGDRFEIYHENRYIDSTYIGIGQVFAAKFTHGGKEHFAYYFEQEGKEHYFDADGINLRRSFLKAPLKFSRISSRYTNSRMHPILRIRRPHRGVDYVASAGTPVRTIGDGKVVKISYDKASGHYIKIKHNSVYTSGYMHLQRRPPLNVGDHVKQGQTIGNVGQTGYATGPHLDFRIWKSGNLVDPLKVESPPADPVKDGLRPIFDSLVLDYKDKLEYGIEMIYL